MLSAWCLGVRSRLRAVRLCFMVLGVAVFAGRFSLRGSVAGGRLLAAAVLLAYWRVVWVVWLVAFGVDARICNWLVICISPRQFFLGWLVGFLGGF